MQKKETCTQSRKIHLISFFLLTVFFSVLTDCQSAVMKSPENTGQGVLLGIFHEGSQTDLSFVNQYEEKIEKEFASVMWYQDWSSSFPMEDAERVSDAGYMPHITWEPWFFDDPEKIKLDTILSGEWDEYINDWAADAARFGKPVLIRWGHEFNGNWYPWSVEQNGKNPQQYIDAYRKIHDAFVSAGADNVMWIWCANANSVPNEAWNVASKAYPGDDYVDWIGIDGYNFSSTDSFKTIFSKSYKTFVTDFSKPIMIAEFATGGEGSKKGDWVKEMAADLEQYFPAIKAITWFDINKELDWRLIVDNETEEASKSAFSSEYFQSEASSFVYVSEEYASIIDGVALITEDQGGPIEKQKAMAPMVSEDFLQGTSWGDEEGLIILSSDGEEDMKAEFHFAWNKEAFYVKADVTDDIPLNNNKTGVNIWNGDNIEICLGLDPAADPARAFFNESDFQIGFSTGSKSEEVRPGIWAWGSIGKTPEGAQSFLTETEQGYILEGIIPWSSIKSDFIPEAGMELGLDFAVDDADESADRESQIIWNGDSSFYSNPSQWGILILE
jgi:beta-mannanase